MLRFQVLCAALCVFACFHRAQAQTELAGATVNGTVTDPSGAAVVGATVTLTGTENGFTRKIATSSAGQYTFARVPVGKYDLETTAPGFSTQKRSGIELQVGADATIDIQMQIGSVGQTVDVTADAPIVETTRSSTATTVNEESVQNLPVNGRNFLDFTTLTPGVVRDPTRGGDLSFAGQRGTANSLLVDGGDSDNVFFGQALGRTGFRPFAFSVDAVQEFQVNENSYPAEIGRAGGGVINVVTKSGTNAFHGTAFEFYRDRSLNANTYTNNLVGRPKPPYHFNQFGGTVGGRIIKDKLFFFGSYEGQRNTAPIVVVVNQPIPTNLLPQLGQYLAPYNVGANNNVGLARVDWNIGINDRLSVRYNINRFTGTNYENANLTFFSGSGAQEHTGNSLVTTDNVTVNFTHVLNPHMVFDSRYVYIRDNEPGFANSSNVETVIINGPTFGRNNFSPRYTNARTNQIVDSLAVVKGRHSIKFGIDFDFITIGNYFPGLFSGSYTFPSYAAFAANQPSQFQQAFPGAGTSGALTQPNVNEYAAYVQDTWRATEKLTLNLGLRYDYFDYAQPSIENMNAQLLAGGLRTDKIPTDGKNFGPRAGFAYRVLNNDKLVVRGGYGLYYERTPSIITGTAFSQNGIQVLNFTLLPTSPLFPTYPNILTTAPTLAPPNIYAFDPHYKTPRTNQYSFNIEGQLANNMAITVGYLGVHGQNLTRTRDVNLFPAVPTQATVCSNPQCSSSTTTTILVYPGTGGPARPNPAFGRISVFDSGADSVYNGVFIQATKRFAKGFTFLTSYTYSKVIDSVPDATAVVVGTDDAKAAQYSLYPNLDRGPGNADVPHRFVFSGVWDINYARGISNNFLRNVIGEWQLSTIAQLQSGRRYSALVTGDPNNDGNRSTDRPPYLGRNTYQVGNYQAWDMRLSRDFVFFSERLRLRLLGEAFNLPNRANFLSVQNNAYSYANRTFTPVANFGTPQSTYDPRIAQLAARIIF